MAGVLRRERLSSRPAFSFQDLESKARALLDQAHAQARQIVAQAEEQGRRRGQQLEQEAHTRGLEQGRAAGVEQARNEAAQTALEEARQDLARLSQALGDGLAAFEESRRRLLANAERGLIELSLAIARRVCKHDVGSSSDAARANVRALLEMVEHDGDLQLHVNPADGDALSQALPELSASVGRLAHVDVVPDPAVEQGGCVLHSRDGVIDASPEAQLERVARALVEKPSEQD